MIDVLGIGSFLTQQNLRNPNKTSVVDPWEREVGISSASALLCLRLLVLMIPFHRISILHYMTTILVSCPT